MLDSHLIVRTNPVADPENIVVFGDFRITVLGERLIRVEKDAQRIFEDGATQSVWFRNFGKQSFTAEANGNCIEIKTNARKFCINTFEYEKKLCFNRW